jgi:hypothetical protein
VLTQGDQLRLTSVPVRGMELPELEAGLSAWEVSAIIRGHLRTRWPAASWLVWPLHVPPAAFDFEELLVAQRDVLGGQVRVAAAQQVLAVQVGLGS